MTDQPIPVPLSGLRTKSDAEKASTYYKRLDELAAMLVNVSISEANPGLTRLVTLDVLCIFGSSRRAVATLSSMDAAEEAELTKLIVAFERKRIETRREAHRVALIELGFAP